MAAEEGVEADAKIEGEELGREASAEAPQGVGVGEVEVEGPLEEAVDGLDDLAATMMLAACGRCLVAPVGVGGEDRRAVVLAPMRLPVPAAIPQVGQGRRRRGMAGAGVRPDQPGRAT